MAPGNDPGDFIGGIATAIDNDQNRNQTDQREDTIKNREIVAEVPNYQY
jgi:hypothetical protein